MSERAFMEEYRVADPNEFRSLALSLLGAVLVAVFAILFLTPNFQTNDDVFMEMLFSGKVLVDAPNEYYWPSNVLFGLFMRSLYESTGRIDWYSSWVYLILVGSAAGIAHSIHRAARSRVVSLLAALHLSICFLYLFTLPQFTSVALFACGSGTALIFSAALRPPASPRSRRFQAIFAWLLILAGSVMRFDAFVSVLLVVGPLVLCVAVRDRRTAIRIAGTVLAVSLAAGALLAVDQAIYSRPPWSDFITLRNSISKVIDYRRLDTLSADELSTSGWTENDRALMTQWWFIDPEVYSLARIDSLLALAPTPADRLAERIRLRRILPNVGWFPGEQWLYFAFFWICCLPVIGRRFLPVVVATLAALYGEFLLVDILGRPAPWRLTFPLLTVASAVPLMGAALSTPRPAWIRTLFGAGCLLAWAGVGYRILPPLFADSAYRRETRVELSEAFERAEPSPSKLFVVVGGGLPFELLFPPFGRTDLSDRVKIFWAALPGRAPFGDEMLARFGIDDLLRALATREDLFLVAPPEVVPLLAKAFEEHCGTAVTVTSVVEARSLRIMRVRFLPVTGSREPRGCRGLARHLEDARSPKVSIVPVS